MEDEKIDTNELTRKIREKFSRRLAGKTQAERMAFYRQCAVRMDKKIPILLNELKQEAGNYPDDSPAWPGGQDLKTIPATIREKRSLYKKSK